MATQTEFATESDAGMSRLELADERVADVLSLGP
jgi:hypothetical protein